jgi:uncharacterized protein
MPNRPDFPFYAGDPIALRPWQWAFVLATLAVAFALLVAPALEFHAPWGPLVPALLFGGLPLLGLAAVAGPRWKALFGPVGVRQVAWMVGIMLLNLVVTMLLGWLVTTFAHTSPNPAIQKLSLDDPTALAIRFAAMVPQLLGEELFTILPLLACLWLLHTRWGGARKTALVVAWLASAVPFALVHLPTYNWNWVQCLVVIGGARLVLSLAYLATRNLWVSTGAHVLNDWVLFGVGVLAEQVAP